MHVDKRGVKKKAIHEKEEEKEQKRGDNRQGGALQSTFFEYLHSRFRALERRAAGTHDFID